MRVELDALAVDQEQVLIEIESQRSGDQDAGRGGRQAVEAGAAQERVNPRHHLPGVERLRDVVVRAQLQPDNLVRVLHACRQHDDRQRCEHRIGTHDTGDVPPVAARHHEVEHDQVGTIMAQHVQRGLPVIGGKHLVSRLLQIARRTLVIERSSSTTRTRDGIRTPWLD